MPNPVKFQTITPDLESIANKASLSVLPNNKRVSSIAITIGLPAPKSCSIPNGRDMGPKFATTSNFLPSFHPTNLFPDIVKYTSNPFVENVGCVDVTHATLSITRG